MTTLIKQAAFFAEIYHLEQKRKYTGDPYIVHPRAVANLVALVTDDENMIAAAWLHDVVEDTRATTKEIQFQFGDDIAALVSDLTDISKPTDGNRETRKRIDLNHTAQASPRAKTIKLADLIDNTSTITKYDKNFSQIYMTEKRRLLTVLNEGNPKLYAQAKLIVDRYFSREDQAQ